MRVLVAIKRVPDPDNANKIRPSGDGKALDTSSVSEVTNPFDEFALETALRLTEDGRSPRDRLGEVVVVTLGATSAEMSLRAALALGADRAIRVEASDDDLDGHITALALAELARRLDPQLIVLGKQTVDGDTGQVGPQLAARLGWPQATMVSALSHEHGMLRATCDIDEGNVALMLHLPAVVTVDVRVVGGDRVRNTLTPVEFRYADGVRFASVPAIMRAKRKPLTVVPLREVTTHRPKVRYVGFESPPHRRPGCVHVTNISALLAKLRGEAKVV